MTTTERKPGDVLTELRNSAIKACCVSNAYFAPESDADWNRIVGQVLASQPINELIVFADSALHYVDEAANAEREKHRKNGAPNSQIIAQTVADNLRAAIAHVAALARVGGAE